MLSRGLGFFPLFEDSGCSWGFLVRVPQGMLRSNAAASIYIAHSDSLAVLVQLEAVVRRVLAITRADASARLLVFSQWADVLELLAHALQVWLIVS